MNEIQNYTLQYYANKKQYLYDKQNVDTEKMHKKIKILYDEPLPENMYAKTERNLNPPNKKYIINIDKMDCVKDVITNQPESPITICDVEKLNTEFYEKVDCIHEIVDDYIDISPDRSMKIKYCDKCMMTFS